MAKRINPVEGDRHGSLVLLGEQEPQKGYRRGLFRCDCGAEVNRNLVDWYRGRIQSCGCERRARIGISNTKHGASTGARQNGRSPLYRAWMAMRHRTGASFQASHPTYVGVSCDPLWATFEGFRDNQPAGRLYEPGLVLARFNDEGDYSPTNTRWVTRFENGTEAVETRRRRLGW